MSEAEKRLTTLFERMQHGDVRARDEIAVELYQELRQLAARRMRDETPGHTLQATALVSEAYMRLLQGPEVIHDRQHFFALAAQAMRRVLVDHARHKKADKRGGGAVRVTLADIEPASHKDIDVLALEEALAELGQLDERVAKVVELKFFGGLTDREVCESLGTNMARVRRDWTFARGWLKQRLQGLA
jgi:RNA polymerase sigma-70 factor (ECF subfamily)